MKVQLGKEINFKTANEPGTIAKVTDTIAKSGVNLRAFCAWGEPDKNEGNFMLYTDNNEKALEALTTLGYKPTEKETVWAELPNTTGALAEFSKKLGENNIDVYYSYCTASSDGNSAFWVIQTNNNSEALKALG
jgi:hypothetical protein